MATSTSSRDKVARHRRALRAQGLRPVQLWVPDTRDPAFRAEAARQSRVLADDSDFDADMDFIERVSAFDNDDEVAEDADETR